MEDTNSEHWDASNAIEWLLKEGRFLPSLAEMNQALGDRLLTSGAPLQRLRLSMRTLHPLMAAYSAIWTRGETEPQSTSAPHGLEQRPAFVGSPMEYIGKTGNSFRKNLTNKLSDDDHHVLHEFKASGATDYLAIPLQFQANLGGSLTTLTDTPSGFNNNDIEQLNRIATVLAPITELVNSQNTARAMANTCLGARSGSRVLDGQITRGHIETIQAATMICDLRGWTRMSNHLTPEQSLMMVNGFFDLIAEAVEANHGEILKFLGDGVLAVFPVTDETGSPEVSCSNALLSANQMFEKAATDPELKTVKFGIGLHFGDVLYGNVGSNSRLDFTVLGSTVNMTARIESMCADLGERLLYTHEFADHIKDRSRLILRTELKGFDGEYDIMAQEIS